LGEDLEQKLSWLKGQYFFHRLLIGGKKMVSIGNIENRTTRSLDSEEYEALIEIAKVVKKGFKKNMHRMVIHPMKNDSTGIVGVFLSFDQYT
jgi:hypothetical protein